MSYDISLVIDTGAGESAEVVEVGNYTSNVAMMWREALGRPLYTLDGENAGKSIPALRSAVARMDSDRTAFEALNPGNGWGDAEGARDYLAALLAACERHPKTKISISH